VCFVCIIIIIIMTMMMMMVIIIIIIIIFIFHHNIEDVPELTKNKVLQRMKTLAVTHTAVYQWNKMNTAVQILVNLVN